MTSKTERAQASGVSCFVEKRRLCAEPWIWLRANFGRLLMPTLNSARSASSIAGDAACIPRCPQGGLGQGRPFVNCSV